MDPNGGGGDTILADPLLPPSKKQQQQQQEEEENSSCALSGVSDYLGRPVHRGSSGGWSSALFVVGVWYADAAGDGAGAAAVAHALQGGWHWQLLLLLELRLLLMPAQVASFYVSLYLIAIAQGADKPCGLAFAADQFDAEHPRECASRSSLFNWWFFCMAIGLSVSVSVVGYIQEYVGWGLGFGIPCAIVLCAFLVFLLGTPTYRLYAPTPEAKSPFRRLARGLAAVVAKTGCCRRLLLLPSHSESEEEAASDARGVLRLLPISAASLAYGVVYAQVMTLFNKQGRALDRRIGAGLELPPSALQTLGPASILLFVPVYDRALVPMLRWATGNPSGLTTLQRVGAGMVTSLVCMVAAALVEARRLATAQEHGLVDDPAATVPMSWAWIVPQYAMIGVADVLALVGLQELFYDQMPAGLRSLGLALYLSVIGTGGFISSLLISVIDGVTGSGGGDSWFADNLNRAHLDYFYWLLAGLSAVELALFLYLARYYVYKHKPSSSNYYNPGSSSSSSSSSRLLSCSSTSTIVNRSC